MEQFLTHLAVAGPVSASTQNQALNALVFLYTPVLEMELGRLDAVRARRGKRLPVVLAPEEVAAVLPRVQGGEGAFRLIARSQVALPQPVQPGACRRTQAVQPHHLHTTAGTGWSRFNAVHGSLME